MASLRKALRYQLIIAISAIQTQSLIFPVIYMARIVCGDISVFNSIWEFETSYWIEYSRLPIG